MIDIPCHPYFVGKRENLKEFGAKDGVKDGVKELTSNQLIIINSIIGNPTITTSELAQKIGIKFRTLQRHISQLQSMGILTRVGGRKEGHWEITRDKK